MAQNETWLNHDLLDAVKVQYLDGNLFSMDNAGNLIGVKLTRDGVDYSGGGSVSANVIRADGGTVSVVGALSGNTATVVLPQAAYAVPGVVSIVVKLTVSGEVTTIAAVVANVYQSSTDAPIDPGTIIPSVQTLIAAIDAAVASIPADYSALWTSLAPAFSTSVNYTAGQYVTYNGALYRFTTDHAAGAWNSAHVTATNIGSELSSLKSAFNNRFITDSKYNLLPNNKAWSYGSISSETGENIVVGNSIRTTGFINVTSKNLTVRYSGNDTLTLYVYEYTDSAFVSRTTISITGQDKTGYWTLGAYTTKIRFAIYRANYGSKPIENIIPKYLMVIYTGATDEFIQNDVLDMTVVDDESISKRKIKSAVFEEIYENVKDDYFEDSINIVPDSSLWELGAIDPTTGGNISAGGSARTIGFIPISPDTIYRIRYAGSVAFNTLYFAYYTTDNVSGFISRASVGFNSIVATPTTAAFLRIATYKSSETELNTLIPKQFMVSNGIDKHEIVQPKTLSQNRINKGSVSLEKLSDELSNKIKNIKLTAGSNIVPSFGSWEVGYINSSTGVNTTPQNGGWHNQCVRTDYIPVNEAQIYFYKFQSKIDNTSKRLYIYKYDENKAYLGESSRVTYSSTSALSGWANFAGVSFIKIVYYLAEQIESIDDSIPCFFQIEQNDHASNFSYSITIPSELFGYESIMPDRISPVFKVPSYYFENEYITGKASRINSLIESCAAHGTSFIFITDVHVSLNQNNSNSLIYWLSKKTNIRSLVCGGDIGEGNVSFQYCKDLRIAFPEESHHVRGNHEWLHSNTGDFLYYTMDSYNTNEIGNNDRGYYYVDNAQEKTRYIVLSSFAQMVPGGSGASEGYEQAQCDWFENVALQVETGWTIIIFTHNIYDVDPSDPNKNNMYVASWAVPIVNILNTYNGNGTIAGVIQGHTHRDRIHYLESGIPVIITTCDKNIRATWQAGGVTRHDLPDYIINKRVSGTISEQAFDVFILNKEEREWKIVRIGCQAEDGTGNDQGDFVEERTVTY